MLNTRRFSKREQQLSRVFTVEKMKGIWEKYIRSNLRKQPINDLHDYYDFHIHRKERLLTIRNSILNGIYQPNRPTRFRLEKKNGVVRHLVIIAPEDALVLEAIAEHLLPIVQNAQPSNNAYYSRNFKQPKSATEVDDTFSYPWWILWPEFQKKILDFTKEKSVMVVTDIANYYDNINFSQLRNFIASLGYLSEIYLDFIFFVLEKLVWRPDYLPYSGTGLPQINIDCPRLLAHSFLFEIDRFLKENTDDHFVRWLDDIDFGCDSHEDAKLLLRDVNELLLSRGLHLNLSKTKVLKSKEAFNYFQIRENRYLNVFEKGIKTKNKKNNYSYFKKKIKKIRKRFKEYIQSNQYGQWKKVIKRYFTIFGKLEDNYLEEFAFEYIYEYPELREHIFRYLSIIGWSFDREEKLQHFILNCIDDDSFFRAIKVLLEWQPDSSIKYILRMRQLVHIFDDRNKNENNMQFLGCLWLLGKFGSSQEIENFINHKTHIWKTNGFLARQVTCLYPRIESESTRDNLKNIIRAFGLTDAILVLENYNLISKKEEIFKNQVKNYIRATHKNGIYPLHKLLITLSVLSGSLPKEITNPIKDFLLKEINCKICKYYIKVIDLKH